MIYSVPQPQKLIAWKTAVALNLTLNFTLKTSLPVAENNGTFLCFLGGLAQKNGSEHL